MVSWNLFFSFFLSSKPRQLSRHYCKGGGKLMIEGYWSGPAGGFANIAAYFGIGLSQTSGLLSWFVLTLGLSVRGISLSPLPDPFSEHLL